VVVLVDELELSDPWVPCCGSVKDGEAVAAINGEMLGSVARDTPSVWRLRVGTCVFCRCSSSLEGDILGYG
jgi:hypothetical protein